MGFFKIKAEYLPLNYKLILEHTEGIFNILILDTDGAQTSLHSYEKYESQLNNKNVSNALVILKRMLEENSFDFLVNINDEYFFKNSKNGEMSRISKKQLLDMRKNWKRNMKRLKIKFEYKCFPVWIYGEDNRANR